MKITLNGETKDIPNDTTVAGLLSLLRLEDHLVAVEVNRSVVKRVNHPSHRLCEGDSVEVVHFVGGG